MTSDEREREKKNLCVVGPLRLRPPATAREAATTRCGCPTNHTCDTVVEQCHILNDISLPSTNATAELQTFRHFATLMTKVK